jgi:tungstate transport system permease protein
MDEFSAAASLALALVAKADPTLVDIVLRSLRVSLSALAIAGTIGLLLAALLTVTQFPGRSLVIIGINAAMGLPPVVVGLAVYLLLSRAGPLGDWGLLFSPTAMVIAQVVLLTPLICGLARQTLEDAWREYGELFASLDLSPFRALCTLLVETRHSLLTTLLAGFGRAISEVGAVLIVGGNIAHVTRVMTTTIAMETSRGNLALALALGFILILLAMVINAGVFITRGIAQRQGA